MNTNMSPTDILENLYKHAQEKISQSVVKSDETLQKIEFICRCNTNKAPIRFLISCLLAKIHNPQVDIRKPYTEIEGDNTYSGRFYDEQ
ncbi:MAG: hypothetical protein LBC68_10250, partial [Prevotellaceae bacterium]|nr:hypothetical protein [Prevotellaceae bacterium]